MSGAGDGGALADGALTLNLGPNMGYIRFSPVNGRFEAVCPCVSHAGAGGNPCKLRRCSHRGDKASPANGRPLGTLLAWLSFCHSPGFSTRDSHQNVHFIMSLDHRLRDKCRSDAKAFPNYKFLAERERPQDTGEPEEPLLVPMGF